jgi:putative nucleotidyltransferase with HDIG domain
VENRANRWSARPFLSLGLRAVVLLVPIAAGVGVAAFLSRAIPRPEGGAIVLWWLGLFVASTATVWAVDRVARRLLPLAVLLQLTMLFPDRAPSRFAVARRVGSTRSLEERVRLAREAGEEDDPSRAAVRILELVAALNAHDRQTRGHSERVRVLTDLAAGSLKLPEADRDRLRWAALLHDIGKLEVSTEILNKPGRPEPHEWEALKRHPAAGARLAGPLFAWLGQWGSAIEEHHERFDGDGYPAGLAGTGISLGGRILTVTDSFETMTASRSYKKPMSVAAARRELTKCAGTQFDPDIVRAFIAVSLGRLWWKVGPVSWAAQLPFISLRSAGTSLAGAARAGTAAITQAVVGLTALGASAFVPSPPAQHPARPAIAAVVAVDQAADGSGPAPAPDQGLVAGDEGPGARGGPGSQDGDPTGPGGPDGSGGSGSQPDESGGGGENGGGGGGLGGVVEDTVDTVDDTVDEVVDVVEDVGDELGDTVDGVVDTVGDVVDGLGDVVGGLGG